MHENRIDEIFNLIDENVLQVLNRWQKRLKVENLDAYEAFKYCFTTRQEFRSVIKYRCEKNENKELIKEFLNILKPGSNSFVTNLYLSCNNIGSGLYIEHGFSTIVFAKSIGENFHLNQNVTIGTGKGGIPEIDNNVSVYCNSVIIGGIEIGNNVKVAAGAIVINDVQDNCLVASPKAEIKRFF